MEKLADTWKKYPVVTLGELSLPLPGCTQLHPEQATKESITVINNYYFIVTVPSMLAAPLLGDLLAAGVLPVQIILYAPAEDRPYHELLAHFGLLEAIAGESDEEFRLRLLSRLEVQRQKQLSYALETAAARGLVHPWQELELSKAADTARIAHALAYHYGLLPQAHARALEKALACRESSRAAWQSETATDTLIAEAACLLVACSYKAESFREALKEKSANLPFRVRTDLLHQVETALALTLGGKSAA